MTHHHPLTGANQGYNGVAGGGKRYITAFLTEYIPGLYRKLIVLGKPHIALPCLAYPSHGTTDRKKNSDGHLSATIHMFPNCLLYREISYGDKASLCFDVVQSDGPHILKPCGSLTIPGVKNARPVNILRTPLDGDQGISFNLRGTTFRPVSASSS